MGKMATVIVLGLVLASVFLGYSLNRSNVSSVGNMTAYYKYSTARNIAHTAVTIALHQLETGHDATVFTGDVMSGRYDVSIAYDGDTLNMTSRGHFIDTSYTMILRLLPYAKPFPNVQAAVMLPVDSVRFSMNGTPWIDGRNHDINGNLLSDGNDKAGVLTMTGGDSTTVAAYNSQITGSPQVNVDPDMANPLNYVDEYITDADYNYTAGKYGSNATWGSASSPVIVVCEAGTSSVEFAGTIEGWGILVVKGNLALSGSFTFHGLVLVYQTGSIDDQVTTGGAPRVIGAIIMTGGDGSKFQMKGSSAFLYSQDALDKAQHIKKLQAYRILSWYE